MEIIENISACIIARNEESTIERCIKSIKPFCSQIIVVDTGSTDNTASISTRLSCEVYFHKWEDDFSLSRNFALSYAIGDWILIIDCDEYLDSNFDLLGKKVSKSTGGFNLKIHNFLNKDNTQISEHRYTRFFRNDPRFKFRSRIHEQIRESIEENSYEVLENESIIFHTGYIDTSLEKKERNKTLLEGELNKSNDDFTKFNLAETEFSLNNLQDAQSLYESLVNSSYLSKEQNEKVLIRLAQILLSFEKYNKAIELLDFSSEYSDNEALKIFVLGASYLNLGDFEKSHKYYTSPLLKESSLIDHSIVEKALFVIGKMKK